MILRFLVTCGLVGALLAVGGCDQGRQTPGRVAVRVIDVAPSFAQLLYRREQTQPTTLTFKSGQQFDYGADTYDFYVGASRLDTNATPPTAFATQLKEQHGYTFVFAEAAGAIVPAVLEYPVANGSDAQIVAFHAGESLPAVDLYLERPGVGIAGATPRGNLAFRGQIAPRTLASGEYELWLTAAGNPSNVLLASSTVTLPPGATSVLIVTPEAGGSTAPLTVTVVQDAAGVLYDRNATSELRVINGAANTLPRDFAIAQQFSPPLFSAVPFARPTNYATVPVGTQQINVTPVGNPGVLELNQTFTAVRTVRSTILFAGDPGVLSHISLSDDRRRLVGEGKVQFLNAATQFGTTVLEFLMVPRGGNPTDYFANALLAAPGGSPPNSFAPGDYDFYIRNASSAAIVAGPTPLHINERGIYGILAVNGPNTATATVVLLDDFQ